MAIASRRSTSSSITRTRIASDPKGTIVPRNVRLAEAPSFGKPIILYDVASVGAQAYMSVARELMERTRQETAEPAGAATT